MIIWPRQVKKYVKSSQNIFFHLQMIFFHDFQANFAKVKNRKFHHFFPSKSLPRYLLQKPQICKNVQFSTFQAQNMSFGVELHQITSGEAQTTAREQPHQISWQADKQKILFLDFRHPPLCNCTFWKSTLYFLKCSQNVPTTSR